MLFQIFLSLAVFAVSIELADTFSSGLVAASCKTLTPEHGVDPEKTPSPYVISVSKTSYNPGDTIMVTLNAPTGSTTFRGFLLQARVIGNTDPVGSFISFNATFAQNLDCNNSTNSSVSHRSAVPKTELKATWEAPNNTSPGDIVFCATFVETTYKFWVNVSSPKVSSSSFQLNFPLSKYTLLAVTGLFLNYY